MQDYFALNHQRMTNRLVNAVDVNTEPASCACHCQVLNTTASLHLLQLISTPSGTESKT